MHHFKHLKDEVISKLADIVEEHSYENNEYIVRQGARGDTCYIISRGRVKLTRSVPGQSEEQYVKTLYTGDGFGEAALRTEETRPNNVITSDPAGVNCLMIERRKYKRLVSEETAESGPKTEDGETVEDQFYQRMQESLSHSVRSELSSLRLADLTVMDTLGIGAFGRVELVQLVNSESRTYALKQMGKQAILDARQEEHIINEKRLMMDSNSPFICKLYRTFKDRKYLYMLLELCQGGDLFTMIRDKGPFDDVTCKFYIACVVEALSYLHFRGICYRGIKPENLVVDNIGYVKIIDLKFAREYDTSCDFGFAKEIGHGKKTWTFCGGSPEYCAPEIILNQGHDISVDYWCLGVLLYEMNTGSNLAHALEPRWAPPHKTTPSKNRPPFQYVDDPLRTYTAVLRGIGAVRFPKRVPRNAISLIRSLCKQWPSDRIGYGRSGINDIRKHKWYDGFNWEAMKKRTLKAPNIPKIRSAVDKSYFDHFDEADETYEPPDELSCVWDKDF